MECSALDFTGFGIRMTPLLILPTRDVITNPPADFNLLPSDQVFVLMQFDPGMEYQAGWGDATLGNRVTRNCNGVTKPGSKETKDAKS